MAPFSGKKVPKVDRLPRPWLDEAEKRNPESPLIDFRDSSDFGRKNLMVEAGGVEPPSEKDSREASTGLDWE